MRAVDGIRARIVGDQPSSTVSQECCGRYCPVQTEPSCLIMAFTVLSCNSLWLEIKIKVSGGPKTANRATTTAVWPTIFSNVFVLESLGINSNLHEASL